MNWNLIFRLSLFGLLMGLATVFLVPSQIEPFFWLAIFAVSAYFIAQERHQPFLHGLLTGIANGVWVTSAHVIFFDAYVANHSSEMAMMNTMTLPGSPRVMMAIIGAFIGVVSGLVLGLLSFLAVKIFKRDQNALKASGRPA